MSGSVRLFVCAFTMIALAEVSSAATVNVDLWSWPDGAFEVRASASPGDNDGIAGFLIRLTGHDGVINSRPHGVHNILCIPVGFNVGGADLFPADRDGLFAGQNTSLGPNNWLFHVGQFDYAGTTDGNDVWPWSTYDSRGRHTVPYDAYVLLGYGTTVVPHSIDFDVTVDTLVNVFGPGVASGDLDIEAADVVLNRYIIPEPTSFATLGIAVVCLLGLRRRKPADGSLGKRVSANLLIRTVPTGSQHRRG